MAQLSCKQSIHKELWDVKGNRSKGKNKDAKDIYLALDNIKAQIIKHYQRISDKESLYFINNKTVCTNPNLRSETNPTQDSGQ